MKKIIKRKLHISTYSRDFIDYINHEFYSHDKHNAFFEFTMEQLPTDNVVALFYFQKTKRYAEIHGVVEDNKVTIEFDTSLITTNETVCGYIYFEKVEQSADVCRFCFNVKVSEIDKLKNAPVVEKETRRLIPMSEIVTKTELQELFKTIEKNGGTYNDTEIRKSITSIEERVETLENKPDNNTVYDDSDVINRLNALENNASSYLTEHQPLTSIEVTIKEIVKRFNNLSNIYLTSHQSLEHLATNDALNKVEQRVQQLEQARGSQPIVDSHDLATNAKVEAIEERVQALENKPSVDTSEFAKKTDIPQAYDDEELKRRLNNLEGKTDNFISGVSVSKEGNNVTLTYNYVDGQSKNVSFTDSDTINIAYDDSALKSRLNDLENRPQIDVSEFAKKSEVPTTDSVNDLVRIQGEQATKISTLESKSAYEIHGTGMPNGRVTAPIGTTYVDMNVTNGALKWIKRTGTGNTGWQVFTGDTGWRTLPLEQKRGTARLQIRRINDQVIVKFDGLQWGWFGVNDIEKLGGSVVEKTIGGKKYTWIKLSVGRGVYVLPEGFRSSSSLLSGLYGDLGDLLGSVYVGGTADSNAIQLRYAMERNALTSNILSQIRISPITFITDDDYPTTLP